MIPDSMVVDDAQGQVVDVRGKVVVGDDNDDDDDDDDDDDGNVDDDVVGSVVLCRRCS